MAAVCLAEVQLRLHGNKETSNSAKGVFGDHLELVPVDYCDNGGLKLDIHIYFREALNAHTHTCTHVFGAWRMCGSCFLLLQPLTSKDLDITTRKSRHARVHGHTQLHRVA